MHLHNFTFRDPYCFLRLIPIKKGRGRDKKREESNFEDHKTPGGVSNYRKFKPKCETSSMEEYLSNINLVY